ncbi:hypothetical protein DFQ27_005954 [Actinomortierella ambigua]|uniref:FAD-binding domain-containing protein n=1 Tax=Actinomortierella ambigua TaxID=1343610 RepID=A0A9P6UC48_9FUNG|nr:hypothetical protein DFQ27_005954 [Actinomortierella ambigua]
MATDLRVLIAGSGLAGLMFGIMLEKAGIEYLILERSAHHRPLGSAIQLNGTVLRLFEQLGMIDEINAISKSSGRLHVVNEYASTQGYVDFEHFHERYGYHSKVFARPDLHHLLVSKIPPERLIMGKRILSTQQNDLGVMVRCQDGTSYHADILVGADGAYSSVRAAIFKELKDKSVLPRSDSEPMRFDQHCVVGVTEPLDPEEFPVLKQQFCEIHAILGKKSPYSIYLVPVPGDRFAWSIGGRLPQNEIEAQGQNHSYAEWKPENAEDICNMVRDFSLPELSLGRNPLHIHSAATLPDPHTTFELAQHHQGPSRSNDNESICSRSTGSELASDPMSDPSSTMSHPTRLHTARASTNHLPHDQRSIVDPDMLNDPDIPHKSKYRPPARPGTVGRLIDATPVELISKVMLEEKFFKSWHSGRSVLIGDACHKLLPFAGQGAIQAFLDGISLANKLYDLRSTSTEDIKAAFKAYTDERAPIAKTSISGSRSLSKLLHKQGMFSDLIRKVTFNHVPTWMLNYTSDKMHTHRPQLNFLPIVPDRGTAKAQIQHYSPRYLSERAQGIVPRPLQSYSTSDHQQFQKQHQEWQQQQQPKRHSLLVGEQLKRRSLVEEHRGRRRSHDDRRTSPSPERHRLRPRLIRHATGPSSDAGGPPSPPPPSYASLSATAQFYQDLTHLPTGSLPRPLGSTAQRSPPTTMVTSHPIILPKCPPRSASLPPKVSTAPLHIVPRSSRSNTLSSRCSREHAEEQQQQMQQIQRIRWSQELEECLEVLPVIESDEDEGEGRSGYGRPNGADMDNIHHNRSTTKAREIDEEEYEFDYDNSLYVDGFDMPAEEITATLSQRDHKLVTKDNTIFAFPAPPPSVCTSGMLSVATSPLPSLSTTPLPSIPSDDEDEDEPSERGVDDAYMLSQHDTKHQHSARPHANGGMLTPPSTEEIVTSTRLHHHHRPRTHATADPSHLPEMSAAEHQHLLQLSQQINQVHYPHQHNHHGQGHAHPGHFGQHHHAQHHPHYAHPAQSYHQNAARSLPPGGTRPPRDPQHRPATPLPGMTNSSQSPLSSASSRMIVNGRVVTKAHSSASLRPIDEARPLYQNTHQNSPLGSRLPPPRINTSQDLSSSPSSFSCPASPTTTTAPYTSHHQHLHQHDHARHADLEASLASMRMGENLPADYPLMGQEKKGKGQARHHRHPSKASNNTSSSASTSTSPSSSSLHLALSTASVV